MQKLSMEQEKETKTFQEKTIIKDLTHRLARLLAYLAHLLKTDWHEQQRSQTEYHDQVLGINHLSVWLDICYTTIPGSSRSHNHKACKYKLSQQKLGLSQSNYLLLNDPNGRDLRQMSP